LLFQPWRTEESLPCRGEWAGFPAGAIRIMRRAWPLFFRLPKLPAP
jgi:hypothetical protein